MSSSKVGLSAVKILARNFEFELKALDGKVINRVQAREETVN